MQKENVASGIELLFKRIDKEERSLDFYQWVLDQNLVLKGRPFSFQGFEELEVIYQDMHPDKTFRKGVQIGITTYALLYIFWRAQTQSMKGMYFVPSDVFLRKFSPDRVSEIVNQLKEIKEQLGTDSKEIKVLEASGTAVYFCGLNTEGNVASVDADTAVFDEFDISNQTLQKVAKDRLMRSYDPVIMKLSKPTIPGFGIDKEFEKTDQHFRLMKCPSCGEWNDVIENFPKCLKPAKEGKKGYLACKKCSGKLDPKLAEWVPKEPQNKEKRGYHLSQLYITWVPPDYDSAGDKAFQMLNEAETTLDTQIVYQSVAGLPYASSLTPITDEILNKAHGAHGLTPCYTHGYLGFDQGDDIHYVIGHLVGDILVIHMFGKTTKFSLLYELMADHNVWCAVGDALPNKHSAKDWAFEHEGYAYIQYFSDSVKGIQKGKEIKDEDEEEQVLSVTVDRDESLDITTDKLAKRQIILPSRKCEGMEEFREHLKNGQKERVETAKGVRIRYKTKVKNHYLMALNSCRIASRLPVVRAYGLPLLAEGGSFYDN